MGLAPPYYTDRIRNTIQYLTAFKLPMEIATGMVFLADD